MKQLGKDLKALGLDLTTASDDFDVYPANADLDDTLATLFPGGVSRRIYVGGAGDLKVLTRNGDEKIIGTVAAGTLFDLAVVKIIKTGTTATLITVFY
jgi:hypothetical protein